MVARLPASYVGKRVGYWDVYSTFSTGCVFVGVTYYEETCWKTSFSALNIGVLYVNSMHQATADLQQQCIERWYAVGYGKFSVSGASPTTLIFHFQNEKKQKKEILDPNKLLTEYSMAYENRV